jgi:hypothetical protein
VTAGQRLIEQGVKQGIEHGERALLLRLLQRRFGNVDADTAHRVATASTEQIDTWVERASSAATLAELLD